MRKEALYLKKNWFWSNQLLYNINRISSYNIYNIIWLYFIKLKDNIKYPYLNHRVIGINNNIDSI